MDSKSMDCLMHLMAQYDEHFKMHRKSPEEFVKECVCTQKLFVEESQESPVDLFLKICSFKKFLSGILRAIQIRETNGSIVLLYFVLFGFTSKPRAANSRSPDNFKRWFPSSSRERRKFTTFFFKQDMDVVMDLITSVACKIYDVDYTTFITKSIMEQLQMAADPLGDGIINDWGHSDKKITPKRPFTQGRPPVFSLNALPPVPENTVINSPNEPSIDISCEPHFDIISDLVQINHSKEQLNSFTASVGAKKTSSKLSKNVSPHFKMNRSSILRKKAGCVSKIQSPIEPSQSLEKTEQPSKLEKSSSLFCLPTFRGNKAMVLRSRARVSRILQQADESLKCLLSGSQSDTLLIKSQTAVLEDEKREKHFRDLEKKRLLALLTHEDAKLARIMSVERRKTEANCVKMEKTRQWRRLVLFRQSEMQRLRKQREATEDAVKLAKEAQMRCIEEKQRTARKINAKLRQETEQAVKQRQADLAERAELIREIRGLEQIRREMRDERRMTAMAANRTQTSGFGFLGEMSLCQLKEALAKLKCEIHEQTSRRCDKIRREKAREHEMMAKVAKELRQFQDLPPRRCLARRSTVSSCSEDEEIIKLRQKLEEKRQLTSPPQRKNEK